VLQMNYVRSHSKLEEGHKSSQY